MSELLFSAVFQDISSKFRDQAFCAMYFGRHFKKNLLILKHHLTVMVVLGDAFQWSTPELIKAVSFRGDRRKGIQIVGSNNVILLLDDNGCLWKLINAFEASAGENESFHSLKEECFYEWIPFKKFNFVKVLAISAIEHGFACLGLCRNLRRKLVVLSIVDSALEEYTFEDLNTSETNIFSYHLTNLKVENSAFENTFTSPALVVTDKFSGKTYICDKNGKNSLINVSNNILISVVHFHQEKCLILCFENGKLIFCFYNEHQRQSVAYLSKKLLFVDKCICPDSCLLWSDGTTLNHTKLLFNCAEDHIKLSHLKLSCYVKNPLSLMKINQHILVVTINNFYYCIGAGMGTAKEIRKHPRELLLEICKGSSLIKELEEKTDFLSHYMQCKSIIERDNIKEKTEIKWEGNYLAIKSCLGISLREELWKLQLMSSDLRKRSVCVVDLETDLGKEALIMIENPFKSKCKVRVSLIGNFVAKDLFLDLGEISELEANFERDILNKQIQKILRNRSKFHTRAT